MQPSHGDERRAGIVGRALEKRDLIAGEIMIGLVAGGIGMVCARLLIASTVRTLLAGLRRWATNGTGPVKDNGL